MNQNSYEENYVISFREQLSSLFKSVEMVFILALINVIFMIIIIGALDWTVVVKSGLLNLLVIAIFILLFYGVLTTKSADTTIGKKIMYFIKRIIDLSIAGTGLVLFSPFIAFVAFAIKVDSDGPIFYRSKRVGQFGKPIHILRFRTIEVNQSEDQVGGGFTTAGKWLHKTALNNLPMFFNVLIGELSLVGPRPKLPREIAALNSDEKIILTVKPGMTGLWQIADEKVDRELKLDTKYIKNWSNVLDINILLTTFKKFWYVAKRTPVEIKWRRKSK
jgi:lipopolysaccharide/colanic/teichoic acid biosynthesis glycosyltransferase